MAGNQPPFFNAPSYPPPPPPGWYPGQQQQQQQQPAPQQQTPGFMSHPPSFVDSSAAPSSAPHLQQSQPPPPNLPGLGFLSASSSNDQHAFPQPPAPPPSLHAFGATPTQQPFHPPPSYNSAQPNGHAEQSLNSSTTVSAPLPFQTPGRTNGNPSEQQTPPIMMTQQSSKANVTHNNAHPLPAKFTQPPTLGQSPPHASWPIHAGQPKPTEEQVNHIKEFLIALYNTGVDYVDLIRDPMQFDPGHMQQMFQECGLSTESRSPAQKKILQPAPSKVSNSSTQSQSLHSPRVATPDIAAAPAPAQQPVDRKAYIERLRAAQGKKGSPSLGSQTPPAPSTPATPAPVTGPATTALKRNVNLAKLRDEARQSAKEAQARKQARERGELDSETTINGTAATGSADSSSIKAPQPINSSRLPGTVLKSAVGDSTPNSGDEESGKDLDINEQVDPVSGMNLGRTPTEAVFPLAQYTDPCLEAKVLGLKETELQQMRARLQMLEAKRNIKAKADLKRKISGQGQVATPTATRELEQDALADATANEAALLLSAGSVPSGLVSRTTSPAGLDAAVRKRKREEIESDISAHAQRVSSTQTRMEALKAQMRELEEAALKEQQDQERLAKELEDLGIDTTNIPASELEQTRDAVVASIQAADTTSPTGEGLQEQQIIPHGQHSESNVASGTQSAQDEAEESLEDSIIMGHTQSEDSAVGESDQHGLADDEGSAMQESSDLDDSSDEDEGEIDESPTNASVDLTAAQDGEHESEDDDEMDTGGSPSNDSPEDEEDYEPQSPETNAVAEQITKDLEESEDGEASDEAPGQPVHEDTVVSANANISPEAEDEDDSGADDIYSERNTGVNSGIDQSQGAQEPAQTAEDSEMSAGGSLFSESESDPATDPGPPAAPAPAQEIMHLAEQPAAVANGPFADDSSEESGEISEGEQTDSAERAILQQFTAAAAEDDDNEDYEPSEILTGQKVTPYAGLEEGEDDDYEPPEASAAVGKEDVDGNEGEDDLEIYDETPQGTPTQEHSPNGQQDNKEPAQVEGSRGAVFTPYVSPLAMFTDYRYNPDFLRTTPGGYGSLTYSNAIDPRTPLCPSETAEGGTCYDSMCPFQHFEAIRLSGEQTVYQLASRNPGEGEIQQAAFQWGLTRMLEAQRARNNNDADSLSELIATYRRDFVDSPARHVSNMANF